MGYGYIVKAFVRMVAYFSQRKFEIDPIRLCIVVGLRRDGL